MHVEYLRLKNFRAFQDVELRDLPRFCVVIGANGTGKSTLFSVFGFLKEAMTTNVTTAFAKLGGSRGIQEVRSRNSTGPVEIELKFRENSDSELVTYQLELNEQEGRTVVQREGLKYRRGSRGQPLEIFGLSRWEGGRGDE